jgi:hypothetical protein
LCHVPRSQSLPRRMHRISVKPFGARGGAILCHVPRSKSLPCLERHVGLRARGGTPGRQGQGAPEKPDVRKIPDPPPPHAAEVSSHRPVSMARGSLFGIFLVSSRPCLGGGLGAVGGVLLGAHPGRVWTPLGTCSGSRSGAGLGHLLGVFLGHASVGTHKASSPQKRGAPMTQHNDANHIVS